MSLTLDSAIKLTSGRYIPRLGLGVYLAKGKEGVESVKQALQVGYRQIDSAQYYANEADVARGVAESGIPRSEAFLTTKYQPGSTSTSPDAVYKSLKGSLAKIDPGEGGYIDLMLVHWSTGGGDSNAKVWSAFAKAQKEGWIKDIRVSNFSADLLAKLPEPLPAVNQIELHPWCQQRKTVEYCQKNGIVVQAYCPIVRADQKKFSDPVIMQLCAKYNKDPAQILIRWSLQKGYVPLPKSVQPQRIKSNADVYDFELDQDDMKALDGLDQGKKGEVSFNPIDDVSGRQVPVGLVR